MEHTKENIVKLLSARKKYILKLTKDNTKFYCKHYYLCISLEIDILIKLLEDRKFFDLLVSNFEDFMS